MDRTFSSWQVLSGSTLKVLAMATILINFYNGRRGFIQETPLQV